MTTSDRQSCLEAARGSPNKLALLVRNGVAPEDADELAAFIAELQPPKRPRGRPKTRDAFGFTDTDRRWARDRRELLTRVKSGEDRAAVTHSIITQYPATLRQQAYRAISGQNQRANLLLRNRIPHPRK